MTISELNSKFSLSGHISFAEGAGQLPIARIENTWAKCEVALYGAHVLRYQPKNEDEVLWLSSKSNFEVGKPIRGGIPVCFPWFGPHPSDSAKPVHGFARLKTWTVADTSSLPDGSTQLVLSLCDTAETLLEWPFSFRLEMKIVVGTSLDISLNMTNTGKEVFTSTNCLHAYFSVGNLADIGLTGLKGNYYEPSSKEAATQGEEILTISKEENRRYFNHTANTVIQDPHLQREIVVAKTGSEVTVVWNPWKETVKNIGDIADEDYASFICVEPANCYQNETTIAPGTTYILGTNISVKK